MGPKEGGASSYDMGVLLSFMRLCLCSHKNNLALGLG